MNKFKALGIALCIVSATIVLIAIIAFVPIKLLVDTIALLFLGIVTVLIVELIYTILRGPQ